MSAPDLRRLVLVADHLTAALYELEFAKADVDEYARPAVQQLRAEIQVVGRRLENLMRVLSSATVPDVAGDARTHEDAAGHPMTHPAASAPSERRSNAPPTWRLS